MEDMLNEYQVRWDINISATSEEDAARQAREIQVDPESLATTFGVKQEGQEQFNLIKLPVLSEGYGFDDVPFVMVQEGGPVLRKLSVCNLGAAFIVRISFSSKRQAVKVRVPSVFVASNPLNHIYQIAASASSERSVGMRKGKEKDFSIYTFELPKARVFTQLNFSRYDTDIILLKEGLKL